MKYYPLFILLLLSQYACKPAHKKINDQGVDIAYNDSGLGDTTLLFVHGWCINKTYWAPQTDFFRPYYRVVAIDLPGYGESGKNRNSWTVEDFGRDVSSVIQQLDLKNVILIGHSMSGQIIVEAASHNKDRVIGLVGVDNFKNVWEPSSSGQDTAATRFYQAIKNHYKTTVVPLLEKELFLPATDTAIKKRVIDDILHADTTIAVASLEQGDQYPGIRRLAALKRKIFLINSDATPTDTAGLRQKGVNFEVLYVHQSGHYPMLEKPVEFDSLLRKAIGKISKGE
ncbi:alpha/beta fold hydrolase [Chitinophaga vietnamensis]|uniref:alpha/beta fold hydrolase n=1 Tax=Chitinophaga vietnamensis TaxID=2593957 RepID=UPI0011776AC1|nr:alpha/beta hydrolase [Chitinophaga vietnamensis]